MARSKVPISRPYDNRFEISSTVYPDDLLSDQYGGNYVMFRIYVHEDSYLVKDNTSGFLTKDEAPTTPLKRGDLAGTNTSAEALAALTAGMWGYGLSKVAGFDHGKSVAIGVGSSVVASDVFANSVGNAKKDYRLQKKSICLYMPNGLSIGYGVNWEEDTFPLISAGLAISERLTDTANIGMTVASDASISSLIEAVTSNVKDSGTRKQIAGTIGDISSAQILKTPGLGQALSRVTGIAANPKKDQFFKNVNYRNFSFRYDFHPRSKEESAKVLEIIKQFKLHMHPEFKDPGEFLYIYPSEFEIIYYKDGEENTNIHKHTSAVLTEMTVNYAPQNTFNSFSDGMPTRISIDLRFRELALLSKEDIQAGY